MLDRVQFIKHFSRRLIELMRKEGYQSSRLKANVDIQKLAKASNCSYQMARRYILGEALPELNVVVNIAKWLNTTASWLLFGESESSSSINKTGALISISPDLLKYILTKSSVLFSNNENNEELINFIVDSIYDASHLNIEEGRIYKIIDMMFLSTKFFKNASTKKRRINVQK